MFYVRFSCKNGNGYMEEFSRIVEVSDVTQVGHCVIDKTPAEASDECINFSCDESGINGLAVQYVDAAGQRSFLRAVNCSIYVMNANGKTIAEYHSYSRPAGNA